MRQEQFERLQQRAEQLIDVFLDESDPATWPGHGVPVATMDKSTRGDRYWCKKNAVATLAVAQRISGLIDLVRRKTADGDDNPAAVTAEADELDVAAAEAEREAERLLKGLKDGSRAGMRAKLAKKLHGDKA
ncbi:hypothetical protein CDN99_06675 [Roseateles aquatilis]|uniref:Uncharacterized protein n=1 Tax=Roseateles aquatilis TaxID=431061 RepID=A0A246JHB8_9BURK|nr:hypothetical protein [Roseateles aquatilis]OWQ92037.1 hypothetical protein CDN99_06675 [Roseateles aquatilis]